MFTTVIDLAADEIHVWHADLALSIGTFDEMRATLSAEESARSARFYFSRDRVRFVVAHAIVRSILAGYFDTLPVRLEFTSNEYGKPALAGVWRDAVSFNLSHSGELALIAVTRGREVGVDVEELVASRADLTVAENYFSTLEVARLRALPEVLRPRGFFNCWTRKEAYIKARGMGLAIPLDSFDVSLAPDEPAALLRTSIPADVRIWQVRDLELGEKYIGAVAASGSGWRLALQQWTGWGRARTS